MKENKKIKAKYAWVWEYCQTAKDWEKQILFDIFGEKVSKPKDVRERVKTFEDACKELGNKHPFVQMYRAIASRGKGVKSVNGDVIAYLKLRIITAALNEGWRPRNSKEEFKWLPVFQSYNREEICKIKGISGSTRKYVMPFDLDFIEVRYEYLHAKSGYRLLFRSKELAEYAGRQFIDIYRKYILNFDISDFLIFNPRKIITIRGEIKINK